MAGADVRLRGGLALRPACVPGPGERHAVKLWVEHKVGDHSSAQVEAQCKSLPAQAFEDRLNRGSPQSLLVKPCCEGGGLARKRGMCHRGTVPAA